MDSKTIKKIIGTKTFLVIAHSFETGPPQELVKFLRKKSKTITYFDHPFFYAKDTRSSFTVYEKNEKIKTHYVFRMKGPELFYYFKDFILTIYFGLKSKQKYDICIACDNLNTFSALCLKKLGIVKHVIYSAVDFTPVRFENYFLNKIYHFINKICCYYCDEIWNSAKPMIDGREKTGIKRVKSAPQIVIPDGNNFDDIQRHAFADINRYDLVFMGHLRKNQGVHLIIEAMPQIIKQVPQARLIIVGSGPLEQELKNLAFKLGLQAKIIFKGYIEKHSDLEKILAKCAIALAPYVPDKTSFSYYSDVGKPKAYMACGLPVIITPVPQIAYEISEKKAGKLIKFERYELIKATVLLLQNDNLYKEYRQNAIDLAEYYKWDNVFLKGFNQSFKILNIYPENQKKVKVLITINGLLPPATEMAGLRIIYQLQKLINQDENIEIFILTSIFRFGEKNYLDWIDEQRQKTNINIFAINDKIYGNTIFEFFKSKIKFLIKAYKLNKKYNFEIIHDYSSAPIIFLFSFFYKKIMKKTVFHTLCTSNKGRLASFRFNWGIRYIDQVICASQYITQELKKAVPNKYGKKISYVSLGIDSNRFLSQEYKNVLKQKLNFSKNDKIILFIGPLEKRKGVFVLAKAATIVLKKLKNIKFIFVTYGQGGLDKYHIPNKQKLLKIVKDYKNYIHILEGTYDIPSLFPSADIFILPPTSSHGTLAQPLTLLEAMSAGKTVIVSNIDGAEEIIKDGFNGLLFNNNNHKDLADKIYQVLRADINYQHLGANAQKDILENYEIKHSAKQLINFYEKPI